MISTRHFFKRLAAVAVCVALAPEIAFNVRLSLPAALKPQLNLTEMFDSLYAIVRARENFKNALVESVHFSDIPMGILEQLQSMPRPESANTPKQFCKDCGKEGLYLCMSCYDARIDKYNATV